MEQTMNEEIPSYVYSHIEPGECRVLKIVEVHHLIKFSLEAFSIYEAPGYEALLYAWCTSSEMEGSLCNGARFRISRTLGQALRGIHAHSGGGWIWVDAICINQTDAEEKAHQVAGMGELYSCADHVLIWPGLLGPDDSLWCAALLLYSRAWFQQLWIVQEVVLARANIAGLHVKEMGEDRVCRSTNGIRLIRNSRRLKDSLEDDEKEITGLQATMDIMQIYAVRDMLSDALRDQMAVDYSDDVKQNYGMVHARLFRGWNYSYLPIIGCQAGTPAAMSLSSSSNSPVVDRSINVLHAHRILRATTDCSAHIPDGADNYERLLGVLIGQCGWLKSPQFSGRPYGHLAANQEHEGDANPVPVDINMAEYFLDQHRFARTTNGRMAIVPCHTKRGDTVCVFLGGRLPRVLSRHEDGVYWKYVRPSVVDGIIEGEVFSTREQWMHNKETFCLKYYPKVTQKP
ncbi:heterokaryon incompatibility protein-domain-containing protein [Aspergillus transmontanensis]|uniref:Heterokaryon incompatibility protein-domain-containing protein n=1 Tax=Aspergillus transmontanensis TaxID=1034304 RepID=A0A5N6VPF3_9EURO|nr:heterokaryon incompatibility protein-domain-containing protein [Aspergillus transmontanensis]